MLNKSDDINGLSLLACSNKSRSRSISLISLSLPSFSECVKMVFYVSYISRNTSIQSPK